MGEGGGLLGGREEAALAPPGAVASKPMAGRAAPGWPGQGGWGRGGGRALRGPSPRSLPPAAAGRGAQNRGRRTGLKQRGPQDRARGHADRPRDTRRLLSLYTRRLLSKGWERTRKGAGGATLKARKAAAPERLRASPARLAAVATKSSKHTCLGRRVN